MIRTVSTVLAASFLTLSGLSAIAAPSQHHHRQVALMANADTAAPTEGATGEKKADGKADKQDKKDKHGKSGKAHLKAKAPTTSESVSPAPATEKAPSAQAVDKQADKK